MGKIVVCQHVPYEILGTLNPLLRDAGLKIKYLNFGRNPHLTPERLDAYDGIVILGGPMNIGQVKQFPHIKAEIDMIQKAIRLNIPILGICLGGQLIASALGAKVRACEKEIGWYPITQTKEGAADPLFSSFKTQETVFQWHGDTFDIPDNCVRLSGSDLCPNQAFRYGDNVYAFQFHLEVDEPMILRWLNVPVHKKELDALRGKIDPDEIKRATTQNIQTSIKLSGHVFSKIIDLFGRPKKKIHLY